MYLFFSVQTCGGTKGPRQRECLSFSVWSEADRWYFYVVTVLQIYTVSQKNCAKLFLP